MARAFQRVSTQTFGYRILCRGRKDLLVVKYESGGTEKRSHRRELSQFGGGHEQEELRVLESCLHS